MRFAENVANLEFNTRKGIVMKAAPIKDIAQLNSNVFITSETKQVFVSIFGTLYALHDAHDNGEIILSEYMGPGMSEDIEILDGSIKELFEILE